MASGRKEKVMIACVTFETAKITEPVKFYDIDKVHLIHYIRPLKDGEDPEEWRSKTRIYREFYERVVEIVSDANKKTAVFEHPDSPVYDFSKMLSAVFEIIRDERENNKGCIIYVNVSAGSSEFAAASAIAAMMFAEEKDVEVIPFSVGTKEYTVPNEKIEELYYIDGKPVGLTKAVREPNRIPVYPIERPDVRLVHGLRVLSEKIGKNHSASSSKMAGTLKEKDLWKKRPEDGKNSNEAVYYYRDFAKKWLDAKWTEKSDDGNYVLTEKGSTIIGTFYLEKREDEASNKKR
ncbi:MAG: DUF6293 family protein [Candidatus Methanoplasma sp.]|jgi:hypothetical protein|nr:DUF6293 family protein [Candidatus Methanoplasma sp.]